MNRIDIWAVLAIDNHGLFNRDCDLIALFALLGGLNFGEPSFVYSSPQ